MFYGFSANRLTDLGFSEKTANRLMNKESHNVLDKYLVKNPGDLDGAIIHLRNYLNRQSSNNQYSVEKYLNMGMSLDEARLAIEDAKKKTAGTIERFIAKYGDEVGRKKFDEFRKKSAHTKETFKLKYGDMWEYEWAIYKKSKDCRSDEYFKKRYGDYWKVEKDNVITNWNFKMSEAGMVAKHGDAGYKIYSEIQNKKSCTLENFIKKYGEIEGVVRYTNKINRNSYTNTISYYIEKYGEDEGPVIFAKRCQSVGYSLDNCIKKYGEALGRDMYEKRIEDLAGRGSIEWYIKKYGDSIGTTKYYEWTDKLAGRFTLDWFIEKYGEIDGKKKYHEKYSNAFKNSSNSVSKSSIRFFEELQKFLGIKLCFGSRRNEKCLIRDCGRSFFYDCVDENMKILYEWNGSAFHYHESFGSNWVNRKGESGETVKIRDDEKSILAIKNGYKMCVIWDFEISNKIKLKNKMEEIRKLFYENC